MEHIVPSPSPMPAYVQTLIRRLNVAGFEAYAVGGCVRDTLLGLSPVDWDIATSALPEQTKEVFSDCHVIETGMRHGTVTVLWEGAAFEITTYRVDRGYTDSRHPDAVTFTRSLLEDVKRRDFTINAMAWHPDSGIHDFFDGAGDLQKGILRCVREPEKRFSEDALRILRALRFCAVYGFIADPATGTAAKALAENLRAISAERIRTELFKLLCGREAAAVLQAYPAVWKIILPEVVFSQTMLSALPLLPTEPVYRLALLLQNTDAAAVLRRLKTDTATIRQVTALLAATASPPTTDRIALKKLLCVYSEIALHRAIILQAAQAKADNTSPAAWEHMDAALTALLADDVCYTLDKLHISGRELTALGFTGKEIGEALGVLLTAVIEERCQNERSALLAVAHTLK